MQSWTTQPVTGPQLTLTLVRVGRPSKPVSPSAYRKAFFARVRTARAKVTENPKEMARALGVAEDTYYRYETRLMMPYHVIPRFCELCDVTIEWLIKGPPGLSPDLSLQPPPVRPTN